MSVWVGWRTRLGFTTWHDTVCADLGIPFPGVNQRTGLVDRNSQWTTAYVNPVMDKDGIIKALVREGDVVKYNLLQTSPPVFVEVADTVVDGPADPDFVYHRPVPEVFSSTEEVDVG